MTTATTNLTPFIALTVFFFLSLIYIFISNLNHFTNAKKKIQPRNRVGQWTSLDKSVIFYGHMFDK